MLYNQIKLNDMNKIKITKLFVLLFLCISCSMLYSQEKGKKSKDKQFVCPENYEIQVKGVGQDGTKVFTIWATGKTINDAVAIAKRDAVAACLFRGIKGAGSTEATPAIIKEGVTDDNQEFFSTFLALPDKKGNGGKYLRYVNRSNQGESVKIKGGYKVAVDVQISYDDLKNYMVKEGKAKKLDFLF